MGAEVSERRGLRPIEVIALIVVIALLACLFAISSLFPTKNYRVDSSQCRYRMNNIGKAILTYESNHRSYPPGVMNCSADRTDTSGAATCLGPSPFALILEFTDEVAIYGHLVECMDQPGVNNVPAQCSLCPVDSTEIGAAPLRIFRCPAADPIDESYNMNTQGMTDLAKGNYAVCFGSGYFDNGPETSQNGMFGIVQWTPGGTDSLATPADRWRNGFNKGTRWKDLRDGTSRTIMLSEVLGWESADDGRGAWFWPGMGGGAFTTLYPPNADGRAGRRPAAWADTFTACDTQDPRMQKSPMFCARAQDAGQAWISARSNHPKGVLAARADASTNFTNNDIDPEVWHALGTIAGAKGEIQPDPNW